MGMALLAPLFLAGAALVAAPYIIHQIRRPEREPVRFSSLMFVPNVQKEVIERKRVQHLLLLLLRMAMLLLLAAAFTRPYWRVAAASQGDTDQNERHYILIDTSYSMGEDGRFDRAKSRARTVLSELPLDARVGLAQFGHRVEELVPLDGPGDAGSAGFARNVLDSLKVSEEGTDYGAALRYAAGRLAPEGLQAGDRLVIHLISDFQRSGMPVGGERWKLPGSITLHTYSVADGPAPNMGLADIAIRPFPNGDLRVVGRVRNWSDADAKEIPARLVLNDKDVGSATVTVRPWSATQVSFRIPSPGSETLTGYVELDSKDRPEDNRRYFTWNAPQRIRVGVVARDPGDARWPAERFLVQAIPAESDLPWQTTIIRPDDLKGFLLQPGRRPEMLIVADAVGADGAFWDDVARYCSEGSPVLLMAPPALSAEVVNDHLLADARLRLLDPATSRVSRQPQSMTWVDLEHPIFVSFAGTKFNDFSSIRFSRHRGIAALGDESVELARLDDDQAVMAEAPLGEGRLIVWGFPLDLNATNFPKHSRFVPVLFETLAYLTKLDSANEYWTVGDPIESKMTAMGEDGASEVELPGHDTPELFQWPVEPAPVFAEPGVLRSRAPKSTTWQRWAAVNVDAREGDLTPVDEAEFTLKMASVLSPEVSGPESGVVGANIDAEGFRIAREYGPAILAFLVLLVVTESIYMSVLSVRKKSREPGEAES
jgi:hypothetical protein